MTAWTNDELTRVGDAEELEISPARRDGTLGWVVPQGGALYVRSLSGPSAAWFRRNITDSITSPAARSATIRLLPR